MHSTEKKESFSVKYNSTVKTNALYNLNFTLQQILCLYMPINVELIKENFYTMTSAT